MKKLLLILGVFMLSCAPSGAYAPTYADTYDFSPYWGKTVKFIGYYSPSNSSCDVLKIWFTDGTTLNVSAYKYTMEIEK